MSKKIIVFIALVVLTVVGVGTYTYFSGKKETTSEFSTFFRENVTKYDMPVIADVNYVNHVIVVEGGIYSLGDVNRDSVIDRKDLQAIRDLIDENLSFSDSQKVLADFNEDGQINDDDIIDIKSYIDGKKVEYDIDMDSLLFCILSIDNPDDCYWQKSNKFSVSGEEGYYIYIKDEMTDKITVPYYLSYDAMNNEEDGGHIEINDSFIEDTNSMEESLD